jgi:hypothetical protein
MLDTVIYACNQMLALQQHPEMHSTDQIPVWYYVTELPNSD